MTTVTIPDAKMNLDNLIEKAIEGEDVVIQKDEKTKIRLVIISRTNSKPKFGSAKGSVSISADFEEPLSDFKEYQ